MAADTLTIEQEYANRGASLLDAEKKAIALFDEIEKTLVRSGVREKQLSDEIHKLAKERYGVRTHWHKRVVRAGPNTLSPFKEDPPDRVIEEDDILYVDLGPVFEEWEADFGRTFVLGEKPEAAKVAIRDALDPVWHAIKARYDADPTITGERLFEISGEEAGKHGYQWGANIAGHIVGSFPHERIPDGMTQLYIMNGNHESMAKLGKDGHRRHWILEVHLQDPIVGVKGFMEQLLTV
ncbi:hypothetical protein M409DRAFT_67270 [Zasmidium cellare ATCC 36951]|uniref:Peptidase M24 domain-containing protein n=1 Tax=Zasmidium cellare ATCC 36951 TaxID=1080233 RepID=A0A6A6CFN0_ZASCE|nr:uncharacterized protein M409DRAFT_67270 [Zasmidium cellare ATCC 36951]KAF2165453.1 hypothetical protein M409DRAFT_67270 [Zasmidium cellare ATCC 36951]